MPQVTPPFFQHQPFVPPGIQQQQQFPLPPFGQYQQSFVPPPAAVAGKVGSRNIGRRRKVVSQGRLVSSLFLSSRTIFYSHRLYYQWPA
jgi:hypothetical protein